MDDVCIMLLTAHRRDYAKLTLRSTLRNLKYEGDIRVHIASDGDDDEYIADLAKVALDSNPAMKLTITNTGGGGYGMSYNLATQVIHQLDGVGYVLPLEDDWELIQSLNLTPLVGALDEGTFGCIRMGYVGWTDDLNVTFVGINGLTYLDIDPFSPEKHVFAGHPRLETVKWEQLVGPWPEGLNPGQTELAVCAIREARKNVGWPVDVIKPYGDHFVHIGSERSYEEEVA